MSGWRVVACGTLASMVVGVAQASAGWVIDQVMKGGGSGDRQQVMLQANQMKTVMLGSDGRPVAAFLLDLNAGTITQVNYEERNYVATTIQEYAQMMQGMQQMASEHMAEAIKEMQEEMEGMPPEQRQMMEQMMRSHMPQGGPKPGDCREPRIEIKQTGQQATIAGYPAVRYDVLADGKLESELWLTTGITAWHELDPKKLDRFGAEMAKLAPRCGPARSRLGLFRADPAWKLVNEGTPPGSWIGQVAARRSRSSRPSVEPFRPQSSSLRPASRERASGKWWNSTVNEESRLRTSRAARAHW